MNHKRGRARNRRAGCKLCKPWKINGVSRTGSNRCEYFEKFSDHKRRVFATQEITRHAAGQ